MLTKAQKKEHVELSAKKIKASKNIVFADFSGVGTADVNNLKKELRKAGAEFKVVKKRLLKIALKEAGIEFDPSATKAPIATVYTPTDLTSVAGPIYKFSRELVKRKINFKVLAAYDAEAKKLLNTAEFTVIAKLPNRETLLAMVIGAMTGPLRAFMSIVDQLAKRTDNKQPTTNNATSTAEIKVETK
ncbi:MAG: 50S ribosomal protein L10 [bacterium]|nr:50S ribosomal protein L10 [bacterium]